MLISRKILAEKLIKNFYEICPDIFQRIMSHQAHMKSSHLGSSSKQTFQNGSFIYDP
jgi:hypothetical protein